ncbi:MAG: glycerophosphodiester phosphodiesterase [Bacteroidales bacterium]|nr:glycerophosphodiester phosphodiesterase [Bacteroidales bacterium]
MKKISEVLAIAAAILAVSSCGTGKKSVQGVSGNFPDINQKGKTAVVAHRGFWNCPEGGGSQNSIASLKAAQDFGFWGSECDIHITSDDVIILNHDDDINGKLIWDHRYSDFDNDLLPNGEKHPTFEQYLRQVAGCRTTVAVIEFKIQKNHEREDKMVNGAVALLRKYGLYDPDRVIFISFSRHICQKIAREHPRFVNQYLSGKVSPAVLAQEKINGIDYEHPDFRLWPEFVAAAHQRGMSVNVWTVNDEQTATDMIQLGVDAITTNEPLMLRRLLGNREFRKTSR